MPDTAQRIVNFQPAPLPGWTAHYVTPEGNYWKTPVVGWLTRDEHTLDRNGDYLAPGDGYLPYRCVVAAVMDDGHVEAVDDSPSYWYVSNPGDPPPSPDDIQTEARARAERAAKRRQAATK